MEAADSDKNSGKKDLLNGIAKDAVLEADKILAAAERMAKERRASAEHQAGAIMKDAKEKALEQIAAIKRSASSRISVRTHRISLKGRDRIIRTILKAASEKLAGLIDRPEYRQVLIGWIVEAAIGLNTAEAEVNASLREIKLLKDAVLAEAEAEIEKLTGRKVTLTKSSNDPLLDQGVVLIAANKRLLFNNLVPTRILRCQSEIRRMINDEINES